MGLPVRQRMVLDRMDRTLRGNDPKLAAIYAIFCRLTRDEEMPRFEQLRHGLSARLGWLRRAFAFIARPLRLRHRRRQRIVLFYPLAIALAVGSIVLAVRSSPTRSCLPVRAAAATKNIAKASLCRPQDYIPLNYGH